MLFQYFIICLQIENLRISRVVEQKFEFFIRADVVIVQANQTP